MTARSQKREVFANPFFVIMMGASVVFVMTVLGYLLSAYMLGPNPLLPARGRGSIAMAEWFDRNAPLALAVEFGVMLVTGVVAMATDPWFSPRSRQQPPE
jgi:hypothetical protein